MTYTIYDYCGASTRTCFGTRAMKTKLWMLAAWGYKIVIH